MPHAQGTDDDFLKKVDEDIKRLKAERDRIDAELARVEDFKRYYLARAHGGGDDRKTAERSVQGQQTAIDVSQRSERAKAQRQQVIDLAIAILKDRNNRPIRREELYKEMQYRGLRLPHKNPIHYVASKVVGDEKAVFGNKNGYYLLDFHPK